MHIYIYIYISNIFHHTQQICIQFTLMVVVVVVLVVWLQCRGGAVHGCSGGYGGNCGFGGDGVGVMVTM
jgi:preprotein translocase subunit SecG